MGGAPGRSACAVLGGHLGCLGNKPELRGPLREKIRGHHPHGQKNALSYPAWPARLQNVGSLQELGVETPQLQHGPEKPLQAHFGVLDLGPGAIQLSAQRLLLLPGGREGERKRSEVGLGCPPRAGLTGGERARPLLELLAGVLQVLQLAATFPQGGEAGLQLFFRLAQLAAGNLVLLLEELQSRGGRGEKGTPK